MATSTSLNAINLKIKKAVRIMSFKERDHHTAALFRELRILPLDKSIDLKYAKFMWKLNNGHLPESLVKNFRTNIRTKFSTAFSRLDSLKKFVLFAGPQLWKDLPTNITNKPSLDSFSKTLKNYFIDGNSKQYYH